MKARTIEWTGSDHSAPLASRKTVDGINRLLRLSARGFLALVPALVVVVGAAWVVTVPDLVIYLQATLWASGFLFLGLAIDTEPPFNGLSLLSGLAIPSLALLSANVAVELAIVGAALVAMWLAAAVWRRQAALNDAVSPTSGQY
ncbi:MAG: hypothetical protein HKN57_14985 [Xanthomonadales bacterium]|nr:hypothetical protein [Gammaproteobacteria bacterium]MBT8054757.1 hypothetical protein [Gammaproteobacteria bacterium]NND58550.1 hypothetical protein [Xanthomonadales bacterium]NNK52244.1 hypothetical protein [Xanthomonadales bacterium]